MRLLCNCICRFLHSMKMKHFGAIFIFLTLFLYGIVQTLYLLSPALERLSNRMLPHRGSQTENVDLRFNYGRLDPHLQHESKGRSKEFAQPDDGARQDHRHSSNHNINHGKLETRRRVSDSKFNNKRNRPVDFKHYRTHLKTNSSRYDTNMNVFKSTGNSTGSTLGDYCPQLRQPSTAAGTGKWKTVTTGKGYVFSAFYESRLWQPAIRIISILAQGYNGNLSYCQVWSDKIPYPEVVPLEGEIVPEGHVDKKFAVYLLTCRLRTDIRPVAVSIAESRCQAPTAVLPVLNTDSSREQRVEFTVCVTPLHYKFNDAAQLVEMVEVNRIFGAERIIFYNYSTGPEVNRHIQQYVREGLAEVVPWKIPVTVDTWPPSAKPEVHYFGQIAALNDCLYRNMYRSQYLVFSDLDEIIMPKAHNTWKDLLAHLKREYKIQRFSKFGAFLFQCAFFRTDWSDDTNMTSLLEARKYNLLTLLKTKRDPDVFPWGMRSKYIADPLKTSVVGIHNVWRFVASKYLENNVASELGLLHHYRLWQEPINHPWLLDRSMLKYSDVIISRVRERHNLVPRTVQKGQLVR